MGCISTRAARTRTGTYGLRGLFCRGQVSMFSFEDKGPAVEKRKKQWWIEERVLNFKRLIQRRSVGEIHERCVYVVKEIGPQSPCSISSFLLSARNHFFPKHFCTKIKVSFSLAMGIAASLIFNSLKQLPTVLLQSTFLWLKGILIKSSPKSSCVSSGIVRSCVAHQVIEY